MSSPPSEHDEFELPTEPDVEEPARGGWEPWRKTMFAGALILLGNAVAEALLTPDQPRAVKLIAQALGFAFLASGFAMKMRSRRR